MSWYQKRNKKPEGMYNASSEVYSCQNCAYLSENLYCNIMRKTILKDVSKVKCGDFLDKEGGVLDWEERGGE